MKAILKISLILVIGLILLGVADYFIPDSSLYQDYIRGTFTETIGIIATLILIEIVLANNRKKEQKEVVKKGLLRATEMIQISLDNYNKAALDIATPWKDKKQKEGNELEANFPFNDLSDLFKMHSSLFEGFNRCKAEVYFDRLDQLIITVRTALYQVDLSNYPNFSEFLLGLIKYTETYYPKNGILADKDSKMGDKPTKEFMEKMILEHKGEVKYLPSNAINNYVRLYEMINFLIKFNQQFESLTKKIKEEN